MIARPLNGSDGALDMADLRCRVLLVDDYPAHRMLLGRILEESGVEVETAQHGGIATAMALTAEGTNRPFDVIITDLDMPIVDGYTVLKSLRRGGCQRPVVAISSHDGQDIAQKCLDMGFDAFIDKRFAAEQLVNVVSESLAALEKTPETTQAPEQERELDSDER